jgi:TRAP-type C4-dicarboxylate transport system substrate-binding protein
VQQSEVMTNTMRALGAEPIALSYGQIAAALSTNLIDGAENTWPSYVTSNHYKVARYYSLTEHTMSPAVLVMSSHAWETLSSEDRDIFREAAEKSRIYMREIWAAREDRSREQARAAGNIIIADIDRKPFENAMRGIYAKVMTDEDARQLIERIRQVH